MSTSGEGRKRSQLSVVATSCYTLGGNNVDLTNMVGVLKAPGGVAEPCLLKKTADGKLGIIMNNIVSISFVSHEIRKFRNFVILKPRNLACTCNDRTNTNIQTRENTSASTPHMCVLCTFN